MRTLTTCILAPVLATLVFWTLFCACITNIPDERQPVSRLIASWDPLACGEPHRIVLELEDESGDAVRSSTPCWLGGLAVDLPTWGFYTGRIYSWVPDSETPIRSVHEMAFPVDEAVVRYELRTPQ
jgi:hypothetical protein